MSTCTTPLVDAIERTPPQDTVFIATDSDVPHRAPAAAAELPATLDLLAKALHRLVPTTEPAAAFAVLAEMCVPMLGDECIVELAEVGVDPYRLSYPAVAGQPRISGDADFGGASATTQRPLQSAEPMLVTGATVSVAIIGADTGGTNYQGALTCTRHDGTAYPETDARLVQLLVEHTVATVRHTRSERQEAATEVANLKIALDTNRAIGVATGILMATLHCTATDAFDLLRTTSQHTNRKLHTIAVHVTRTGTLP